MNTAAAWWGILFGSVGMGYFVYGRKQGAVVPLACGIGLMIYPLFIADTAFVVAIGVVLAALPWFLKF